MSPAAGGPGIQAILLDIEGTTTPVSFVFETLFPYARAHVKRYVEAHATPATYQTLFDQLRDEYSADRGAGAAVPDWVDAPTTARLASVVAYVEWLMDRDRKSTALKELQGRIWKDGYARGELVGAVYPDVPPALARWHAAGIHVGIFSSGSVLAQKLLFRHSSAGDLTPFLSSHFDTSTGAKTDPESYRRIAASLTFSPPAILFLSDVARELDAAARAGLDVRLVVRPGNAPPQSNQTHRIVRSFDDVP